MVIYDQQRQFDASDWKARLDRAIRKKQKQNRIMVQNVMPCVGQYEVKDCDGIGLKHGFSINRSRRFRNWKQVSREGEEYYVGN